MTTAVEPVNAPEAEPAMGFDDPAIAACVWLTNQTYDDLRDGDHDDFPLTDEECALLPGEGGHTVAPCVEMQFGESGILDGERVFIVSVEFFYRNDASRHMWGAELEPEVNIEATMEQQTKTIKTVFAHAIPRLAKLGGTAAMQFREYMQDNDKSTDDRHILRLFIPISAVTAKTDKEFIRSVLEILIGQPTPLFTTLAQRNCRD